MDFSPTAVLFFALAGLAAGTAVAAVVAEGAARAAAWLLGTLAATAGLSFLLGAYPAGVVQLLVATVGAVALRRVGNSAPELAARPRTGAVAWAAAAAAGILLFGTLAAALSGGGVTPAVPSPGENSVTLPEAYPLPLALAAVHLLVAGAAAAHLGHSPLPANDAPAGAPAP